MAQTTTVIITLRKPVPDVATAETLIALVKTRLADNPGVIVTGHVTTHITESEDP